MGATDAEIKFENGGSIERRINDKFQNIQPSHGGDPTHTACPIFDQASLVGREVDNNNIMSQVASACIHIIFPPKTADRPRLFVLTSLLELS